MIVVLKYKIIDKSPAVYRKIYVQSVQYITPIQNGGEIFSDCHYNTFDGKLK